MAGFKTNNLGDRTTAIGGISGKKEKCIRPTKTKRHVLKKSSVGSLFQTLSEEQSEKQKSTYNTYLNTLTKEVQDQGGEIYKFKDKDSFVLFMDAHGIDFQAKYGIKLDIFEEFIKNAFNYGEKNTEIVFFMQNIGDEYLFSVYNLGNLKSRKHLYKNLTLAKRKAILANKITIYESKLLQLINMDLENQDKTTISLLEQNDSTTLKIEKIKELAKSIISSHTTLAKKLSKELKIDQKDVDALATKFAQDIKDYAFKRENTDTDDGIGNGIMFVREKTGGKISYEIKRITEESIMIFEAKVSVKKNILDAKAEKFRIKMGIE